MKQMQKNVLHWASLPVKGGKRERQRLDGSLAPERLFPRNNVCFASPALISRNRIRSPHPDRINITQTHVISAKVLLYQFYLVETSKHHSLELHSL